MSMGIVGSVLILMVVIYFLFRLGSALSAGRFNNPLFPWIACIGLLLFGWLVLNDNNPLGFIGFIPIGTYIFSKLLEGIQSGTSVKKRAQAVALSASASTVVYMVTHHTFGFGVTDASISAFVAAAILGLAGYTA